MNHRSCEALQGSLSVTASQEHAQVGEFITMPMFAKEIEDLLRKRFPDAEIMVQGDDGVHMSAMVVDESFRGMNRVEQQRMVYAALKGKMDGPAGALHALALTTRAPE